MFLMAPLLPTSSKYLYRKEKEKKKKKKNSKFSDPPGAILTFVSDFSRWPTCLPPILSIIRDFYFARTK